ncbi:MAG: SDR family oxidoreductase [Vicinamibacteria bacterium]|nr:SDR family oxidoreductase [Vicinamibacteria bacterium]
MKTSPHILLTGATGFLGRFLLRDLLLAGYPLVVLSRRKGPLSGEERVHRLLQDWRALGHALPEPVILEGAVDDPQLGETARFRGAWPEIDRVVHAAASVSFAGDAVTNEPFRTNVAGTRNVLNWSRDNGVKAFHYVSSAYIAGTREGMVLETELDVGQAFRNPYERSKLEAEQLVHQFQDLETTIYRPSIIVGDHTSEMAPGVRGLVLAARVIRGLHAQGRLPNLDELLRFVGAHEHAGKNLVPVDWVSSVIVDRVGTRESAAKTYHLTSPWPTSVGSLFSTICEIAEAGGRGSGQANDSAALEAFLSEYGGYLSDDPQFDQRELSRDAPHLPCPPINREALVRHVTVAAAGVPAPPKPNSTVSRGTLVRQPLAVVGMACRLPGADNLEEYWKLISEGRCAIDSLPESRLERGIYFDPAKGRLGKTYSDIGGLVEDKPPSAELTELLGDRIGRADPCHQALAEVVLEACRSAGMDSSVFPDPFAGVYVGHSGGSRRGGDAIVSDFAEDTAGILDALPEIQSLPPDRRAGLVTAFFEALRDWPGALDAQGQPRLEPREAARMVKDALRLTGPALVVDAACASSLTALGLAALALESGEIETAIVAGASMLSPQSLVLFSQAQSCSATGSRPFDDDADGLVASEGYVALVVKTLDRAIRDGDQVQAVIRGLGMSSDGRARSLWAPRKEGQIAALKRAYAGLDSPRVDYLEAHATSTQLGDATEIESLAEFFGPHLQGRRLPIGSVKSNLGHTLETAGLAGLVKAILVLQRGVAPPAANLKTLNRSVSWSELPFDVPREGLRLTREGNGARPLRAGVSAFGIGGLNVHVVVEEFDAARPARIGPALVPSQRDEIAIVGRGLVTAGGHSLAEFERFKRSGRSAIGPPPDETPRRRTLGSPTDLGGYIRGYAFDWRRQMIPPKQLTVANPLRFLLLDSVDQALREARGWKHRGRRARSAVIVGLDFSNDFGNELQLGLRLPEISAALGRILNAQGISAQAGEHLARDFETEFLKRKPAMLDETGGFTNSSLASGVAKLFDLMGGALALDTGRSSGATALNAARALLLSGAADSVVCAAGQRAMDISRYRTLARRGDLSPASSPIRPGEGVAAVVLKRLSDARRDGDAVFGLLGESDRGSLEALGARIGDTGAAAPVISLIETTLGQASTVSTPVAGDATTPMPRLVRVGGRDIAELERRLRHAADRPEEAWRENKTGFKSEHRFRAVIVAASSRLLGLSLRRHLGEDGPLGPGCFEAQGIVIRETSAAPPKVAFAFPGQGSHHPSMFNLARTSRAAAAVLDRANVAASGMGLDSFAAMAVEDRLESDPMAAQLSVLVADAMANAALREMGVRADLVFGHSFGELAALEAAGVWSLESALRIAAIRARAIADAPKGRLVALALSEKETASLLEDAGPGLFVTHVNAPTQTVVGGSVETMERFGSFLAARGIKGTVLSVAGALHTPLLAQARETLAAALLGEVLAPPATLLLTTAANRYTSEPEEIRRNLAAQLTEPIRYQALIERVVGDGMGVLIEAGPRSVLSGLHRRILNDRGCILLSSFEAAKGFVDPWLRIQAELEAVGVLASVPRGVEAASGSIKRPQVVEFDATRRRTRRRRMAGRDTPSRRRAGRGLGGSRAGGTGSESSSELLRFLLDFVVEHTGYPEDVIDLDWDLEADLGIDSIKRAQLFGEVADLLRLDEQTGQGLLRARTLRAVLDATGDRISRAEPAPRAAPALAPSEPRPVDQPVTRRHRLTLVEAPLRQGLGAAPRLLGPSLILGSNPVARELQSRIEALGMRATVLPTSEDVRHQVSELERLASDGPIPHLFVTTPRDVSAVTGFDRDQWAARRVSGVEAPFELCRRWLALLGKAGSLADATLVGVLSAGGDHGFSRPAISAESGALSGLAKALAIEQWVAGFRSTRALVVDAPADEPPADLVTGILSELAAPSYDVEVSWERGRRRCVQAREEPTALTTMTEPVRRGAVWVCTGGARGVTSFLARELALHFGLRLHLVGASAPPNPSEDVRQRAAADPRELRLEVMRLAREKGENPVEAWQEVEKALEIQSSLDAFRQAGIEARYHACDVGDRTALSAVLDSIRAQDGPIEGILHGAGFSRDARLEHKRPEHVARCLRAKVDGAFFLMELTREDPVRHFIGMGSISGRFGANGQTDYSLSNDMLSKLTSWYRGQRGDVFATTFDWHAWDDHGMATRAETRLALESIGMRFMPAREGAAHLMAELRSPARETEVLITDDRYARMFGLAHRLTPSVEGSSETAACGEPLFEGGALHMTGDHALGEVVFDPRREPFLSEHRFGGTPLLPFAVALEVLCEAARVRFPGDRPTTLRAVRATQALWFAGGRPRALHVEAIPTGPSESKCALSAELQGPDGRILESRRRYFEGTVQWNAAGNPADRAVLPSPIATWPRVEYGAGPSAFHLGPPFQALQRLTLLDESAFGEIVAPEPSEIGGFSRGSRHFTLPCAVIDSCFQVVGRLAASAIQDADSFPLAVDILRLGRSPDRGEACVIEVHLRRRETTEASFDFRLTGVDGDLLLDATGYRVAWRQSVAQAKTSA